MLTLIIDKIGLKMPSEKTGGICQTIVLEDIDNRGKFYKLYLDDTFEHNKNWVPHMKKGTIIANCRTLTDPRYKTIIDGRSDFKVIHKKGGE